MEDTKHTTVSVKALQKNVQLNYLFVDKVKYGIQHPFSKQIQANHFVVLNLSAKFEKKELPSSVDLSPLIDDVYNQLEIGSCVANSVAMAYRMTIAVYNNKTAFHKYAWYYQDIQPSRLYMYFYNRLLEDISPNLDCGTSMLSGYRSVVEYGVVDEKYWPYVPQNYSKPPPNKVNKLATESITPGYHKVQNNLTNLKHALANKQPVSFGAVLFNSFFTEKVANTGVVPTPTRFRNQDIAGGHALLLVGYDDEKKVFFVKNSWGQKWGRNGICEFPYSYVLNSELCADFWCFQRL